MLHIKLHIEFNTTKTELEDYNVMIDGKNIFHQPVKNDKRTNANILKITNGQR